MKKKNIFAIWKPKSMVNKKIQFFQPVKLSWYPSRTKSEWRLIDKNPFGDKDKDRVPNMFDCKPLNRKKQSYMLRQEIKKKLMKNEGVHNYYKYSTPGSTEKKISEKDIIRQFEKNPDLIKKAEGVKFKTLQHEGAAGQYFAGEKTNANYQQSFNSNPEIHLATIQRKEMDIRHIIKHELQHHEQDTNPKYKKLIKKWDKDAARFKKKYETSPEAEKRRKEIKRTYGEGYELKVNVPWEQRGWEIDAEKFADEPSARDTAKMEGEKPEVIQLLESEPERESESNQDSESAISEFQSESESDRT